MSFRIQNTGQSGGRLVFRNNGLGGRLYSYVPPVYLLDVYSGARVAYSLRKLSSGYSGNVIRVRRSSDNSEQDIGTIGGIVDTSSILSFVGAGNSGYVTTWYDQSGNGINATQTISSRQPTIVSSGTLSTDGGIPSIYFSGFSTYMNLITPYTQLASASGEWSFYSVAKLTTLSDILMFIWDGDNTGSRLAQFARIATGTRVPRSITFNTSGGNNFDEAPAITVGNRSLITGDRTTTSIELLLNGTSNGATTTTGTPSTTSAIATIGGYNTGGGYFWTGYINELIHYPNPAGVNRSLIESNINSYYSIY